MRYLCRMKFIPIPEVDFEELELRARERHAAGTLLCSSGGRFIGTSLGAWLSHAQAAGLECVSARQITSVPRDAFLRIETPKTEDAQLWESLKRDLASLPAGWMARWDHCSSLELKGAMAQGRLPDAEEATSLEPWDPRAWELAYEYPSDAISAWARPWVQARMVDGYPLEFRVFIKDSRVIGVASYYPQRPLPDTPEMLGLAETCRRQAERLVGHLDAAGARPWLPGFGERFSDSAASATMDFLVTESGEVLFLEAGPPYGAGAHPCAFIDRPIEGVALCLAPGVALR